MQIRTQAFVVANNRQPKCEQEHLSWIRKQASACLSEIGHRPSTEELNAFLLEKWPNDPEAIELEPVERPEVSTFAIGQKYEVISMSMKQDIIHVEIIDKAPEQIGVMIYGKGRETKFRRLEIKTDNTRNHYATHRDFCNRRISAGTEDRTTK